MSKTILLVEDNDDTRQMLAFYLETAGYRVVEAVNGFDAIEYANQEPPDLILMDISMPVMDGLTATRYLKENPALDKIPVICVTAHGNYYGEEAVKAGCMEILAKPVDLDNLLKTIKRYI
jgi:two-component system, cell cycle response regulator DivK